MKCQPEVLGGRWKYSRLPLGTGADPPSCVTSDFQAQSWGTGEERSASLVTFCSGHVRVNRVRRGAGARGQAPVKEPLRPNPPQRAICFPGSCWQAGLLHSADTTPDGRPRRWPSWPGEKRGGEAPVSTISGPPRPAGKLGAGNTGQAASTAERTGSRAVGAGGQLLRPAWGPGRCGGHSRWPRRHLPGQSPRCLPGPCSLAVALADVRDGQRRAGTPANKGRSSRPRPALLRNGRTRRTTRSTSLRTRPEL